MSKYLWLMAAGVILISLGFYTQAQAGSGRLQNGWNTFQAGDGRADTFSAYFNCGQVYYQDELGTWQPVEELFEGWTYGAYCGG